MTARSAASAARSCRRTSAANYESDGWKVIDIDGHDFQAIYQALTPGRA